MPLVNEKRIKVSKDARTGQSIDGMWFNVMSLIIIMLIITMMI